MTWTFRYTPTASEKADALQQVQQHLLRRARRDWRIGVGVFVLIILGLAGGFLAMAHGRNTQDPAWPLFLICVTGFFISQVFYALLVGRVVRDGVSGSSHEDSHEEIELLLTDLTAEVRWSTGQLVLSWPSIQTILPIWNGQVMLADRYYIIVPDRLFESDAERAECRHFLDAHITATPNAKLQPRPLGPLGHSLAQAWRVVRTSLRLAFLRPIADCDLPNPSVTVLASLSALIAMHLFRDWWWVGTVGQWNVQGFAGIGFLPIILLVNAAVFGVWHGDRDATTRILQRLLLLAVPIQAIVLGSNELFEAWRLEDLGWFEPSRVGALWLALASTVAICRDAGWRFRIGVPVFAALLTTQAVPWISIEATDSLWVAKPSEDDRDRRMDALTREEAFYRQPTLLADALQRIVPGNPKSTDIYFIGMAGDAGQAVFTREVRSVETLMRERFRTEGRSVVLANHYQSVLDYPIASVTALQRTLNRIGERMNREQDVLFLFLTSHGSREHQFVLDLWPLAFNELNPAVLRRLLDEAGIRWRVIVVSACYSGGYIEPLRDQNTTVITAAAADRSSFGCSDENDWTYFGHAFFDFALRDQIDLEKAFASAKQYVTEREREERVDLPSLPQIAVGAEMRKKWADYLHERTIRERPAPAKVR